MKKLKFKKIIALATSLTMLFGIVAINPTNVKAAIKDHLFKIDNGSITIDKGSTSGLKVTCGTAKPDDNISTTDTITITGGSNSVTNNNITINTKASINLSGCTIIESSLDAIYITKGDTTINLYGNNVLTSKSGSCCGINALDGSTITISGNGTLDATGNYNKYGNSGAGIHGTIKVTSGTVSATGGSNGDGIWGTTTITGGTLTATGSNAYGIYGDATITGGTLNVIGGIDGIHGTTTTINGGTLNANGGSDGIYDDTATINGGTVNSSGGGGINVNKITINGGTVNAIGKASGDSGIYTQVGIEINGGNVNAIGGANGKSIDSYFDLVITGGSVNAPIIKCSHENHPISSVNSSAKTLVLKKINSLPKNTKVDALGITDNKIIYKTNETNKTSTYGLNDVSSNKFGDLYLWLPSSDDNVIVKQGSNYTEKKSVGAEVSFTSPTFVYGDANGSLPLNSDIIFSYQTGTVLPNVSQTGNNFPLDIKFSGDKDVALSDTFPVIVKQKDMTANVVISTKYYDGTTKATIDIDKSTLNGIIGTDEVTITTPSSLDFYTKDVGTNINVSYTGNFGIGGEDVKNYNLSKQPTGLTGNIIKSKLALLPNTNFIGVPSNLPEAIKYTYDISSLLTKKDEGNVTYSISSPIAGIGNVVSTTTKAAIDLNGLLTYYANPNVSSGTDDLGITAQSDNYNDSKITITFVATTATSLTISQTAIQNKFYDGKAVITPKAVVKNSLTNENLTSDMQLDYIYTGTQSDNSPYGPTTTPPINAGNYFLTVETNEANYYYIGKTKTSFSIEKASLTVTADDKTVTKGDAMPTFTYQTTDFANGENESTAFSIKPTVTCSASDTNTVGTFPIDFNEGVSLNYEPTYINGDLTVTSLPTYELTTNASTGGTVSKGGSHASGDKVSLTATATSGYQFSSWSSSNGVNISDLNSFVATFTMPAHNCEVTANFMEKGSYVPTGGNSNYIYQSIPPDSEKVIDTKISNATQGSTVNLSTGTQVAISVIASEIKKINDKQLSVVIQGEKVSIKIPSDSGILKLPNITKFYMSPNAVPNVINDYYYEIDSLNSQLLANTLTHFSVKSGGNEVDTNATITFDLSAFDFNDDQISKLACLKVDTNGNHTVLAGTYDKGAKTFTVPVTGLGTYGVVINNIPLKFATQNIHLVLTIGEKNFTANGKNATMDTTPVIKNNTPYVPLRFVAESLGAKIDWNGDTRTATISLDGKTIEIVSGDNNFIKDNRMMVTLRCVSENLGATVNWDVSTKTIDIYKIN